MIIGITGKSGSGKTYISKMVESMNNNIVSLNIDEVGHYVLQDIEVKQELINEFGKSIINENEIDRRKIGELVFNSRENMKTLSDITWIHMKRYIDEFIIKNKNKIIILEWILLPQTPYFEMCDLKILVNVPYETRLQRALKRDGISKEDFYLREKASIDYGSYKFDYIIENNEQEVTKRKVKNIYDKSIISREL